MLKTISEQDELKHNELDELNDLETEFGENEEDNDDLNDKIIDQEPGDNEGINPILLFNIFPKLDFLDDPETINDLIEGDIAMPSVSMFHIMNPHPPSTRYLPLPPVHQYKSK